MAVDATGTHTVRSACRMCHGVCQVLIHMEGDRVVRISGDPDSPTSRGYLCAKGAASTELLTHPDRLLYPQRRAGRRGDGRWERVSWDEALDEMAARFGAVRDESGPEYLALCQGTGRPYIEFTQRFIHALGSANFVAPAHVCYLSRWLASLLTVGQLPVADVYGFGGEGPACVVMWGCNITEYGSADGMCGAMVRRAIDEAQRLIVVDPRRTEMAARADHWLQVRPGTDGALALAMVNTLIAEDLIDHAFVDGFTSGYPELAEHVRPFTAEWAAPITRVPAADIRAAARTYATTLPGVIQWGSATDMSAAAFQTARSMLILRALTGNLDRPGGDVLWVPPADVRPKSTFVNPEQRGSQFLPPGAKTVAAGRFALDLVAHPPTFWQTVVTGEPYRPRAVWIVGSNPMVTGTHGRLIQEGMRDHLEFSVVSDLFMTPEAELADLVLPAASWLETDDVVSLHKIWCMLARRQVAQVGEARDDREVILQLAHRLGLDDAFPWPDYHSYLAWLLEPSGLDFDAFCERGIVQGDMRYRKYETDGFATPSGKCELWSGGAAEMGLAPLPEYREPALSPVSSPEVARDFPLILTTGAKVAAFFHSEGRQIASLRRRNPDPLVALHPETAAAAGIGEGDWVWVESPEGRAQLRARLTDTLAPDVVSADHGWWFPEEGPPDYGWERCNVNLLFGDRSGYDPETGAEALRCSLCRVYPVRAD